MAPQTRVIVELPAFDTGQYEDCDFLMSGADAVLTIRVSDLANSPIVIRFGCIRWHLFTALYNCTPDQVKAYFRVVELLESAELNSYVKADRTTTKAYRELHHFRIFLDETGCHEVYAQSCRVL